MTRESRHVSERIERSADDVYEYARNPANIPQWAPGLGSAVEQVGDDWYVDTPDGRVRVAFVESNAYRVLDHTVTLPSGESFENPMRVLADGAGCEVVFTVRRLPGASDEEFARDVSLVSADLGRLKSVVEARSDAR
jgi:hypothetical protein